MRMTDKLLRNNLRSARSRWKHDLTKSALETLKVLTQNFRFSIGKGDLIWLERGWYVTHIGLVGLARRSRCAGMHCKPVPAFCNQKEQRWAFEATVYKTQTCRGFVGYGDADPTNVSALVRGAEMRVAETRAVNRALRKAYGIGICSVEEMGSFAEPAKTSREPKKIPPQPANTNYGGPKVRDRLCQIIRQHELNPNLVKAYATDFCGVTALRDATREQVENFVDHLADWAEKDRNAVLCQLNSYPAPKEGVA
jgi:hypothetical protein